MKALLKIALILLLSIILGFPATEILMVLVALALGIFHVGLGWAGVSLFLAWPIFTIGFFVIILRLSRNKNVS